MKFVKQKFNWKIKILKNGAGLFDIIFFVLASSNSVAKKRIQIFRKTIDRVGRKDKRKTQ